MTPRASVIIPVFNKSALTRQCLDALFGQPVATTFEVLVINDASSDDTAALLAGDSRIRAITHDANQGFARSCNDGADAARGELLVFLNNDTIPHSGWLDALVECADKHPDAAVIGSKLLFPDGTIQHAGVVICQDRIPRHIYAGFSADHPAVNKLRPFQVVTAGCALVRRDDFSHAGGFDPGYQNGYEDVDLCLRLGELGRKVIYCPASVLVHLESVSRDLRSSREAANLALYKNRWADKVRPDDVQYYLDDGLLNFRYDGQYPLAVTVSPMLALQEEQARFRQAETLLSHRAKQVMALLKENIRLGVKVSEAAGCKDVTPAAAPAAAAVTDPKVLARGEFRWLSEEPVDRSVSILIPVKNGEKTLRELLPVLWEQKVREKVEIVAIDSGSTDGSVQLLIEAGATVIAIDPRSFNHGLTRNLLASFARGDVLVFLVQDAIPADDHWLANLIAPLRDPGVAGVCSRALPHVDADPLTRFDTMNDPNGSDQRHIRLITDRAAYDRLAHHPLRLFINFHNMASAMRADLFAKYPFRKVDPFGEDLAWAKELLEAGFKIQHELSSVIRHSHDYGFAELLRRNYDDGRASRQIVGRTLADHEVVPLIGQLVRRDWEYLEGETGMLGEELEQWRVRAVLRRTAQIVGQWLGVNQHQLPIDLTSLLSITSRIRQAVMEPAKQEVLA